MGKTYRHNKNDKPFKKRKDYMEDTFGPKELYPIEEEELDLLEWEDEDDDRPKRTPDEGEL